MSLSLSLTQMNVQKYFLSGSVSQKLFFMNEGLCIYTLLNRHIISEIIAVYRLTDSKIK